MDDPRVYHCKFIESENIQESFWICNRIDMKQKINKNQESKILPQMDNNVISNNSMIREWEISSSNIYIDEKFLNYLIEN